MTPVDVWLSDQIERLSLTANQARMLDPSSRGEIPTCPTCGATTRLIIGTSMRKCDRHGLVDVTWRTYQISEPV